MDEPKYLLGINIGFVTNSSSMVHHFPRELLNDPEVSAFLKAFEVQNGFVGENMWHRGACGTIAITREQKQEAQDKMTNHGLGFDIVGPSINVESDEVVVIYGDEYSTIASTLSSMLCALCEKRKIPHGGSEFN